MMSFLHGTLSRLEEKGGTSDHADLSRALLFTASRCVLEGSRSIPASVRNQLSGIL